MYYTHQLNGYIKLGRSSRQLPNNGNMFTNVEEEGVHTLEIFAEDSAENLCSFTLDFEVKGMFLLYVSFFALLTLSW